MFAFNTVCNWFTEPNVHTHTHTHTHHNLSGTSTKTTSQKNRTGYDYPLLRDPGKTICPLQASKSNWIITLRVTLAHWFTLTTYKSSSNDKVHNCSRGEINRKKHFWRCIGVMRQWCSWLNHRTEPESVNN